MLLPKPRSIQLLFACLMAVGLFLPATLTASAQSNAATVKGVNINSDANMIKIGVETSAPVEFKKHDATQKAIVVDVTPAVVGNNVKKNQEVNLGLLQRVTVSQQSANVVRITMLTSGSPKVYNCSPVSKKQGVLVSFSKYDLSSGAKVAKASEAKKVTETKKVAAVSKTAVKAEAPKAVAKAAAPKVVAKAAPKAAPKAIAKKPVVKRAAVAQRRTSVTTRRAPARKVAPVKTVTLELVNADLVYVVKYLAKEMGRNVFVAPDVDGTVTVTLHKVRPEGALALILKMQENDYDYKIVDNTVIVASPEKLATVADNILTPKTKSSAVRRNVTEQEFMLEAAPAASIIEFLKGQYPDVVFTPHPTVNGFYAKGTVGELRQIKSKLPNLDQLPAAAPTPRREYIPIKYGKVTTVQGLVKTLVPDAQTSVDERLGVLIVEGTDADIEQVEEVLANLDKPLDQVMLDCKIVDLNEQGSKAMGVSWSDEAGSMGSFNTTFSEIVPSLFYNTNRGMITNDQLEIGTVDDTGAIETGDLTSFSFGTFGRTPLLLKVAMQFVVTNTDSKVLASPRVATTSGETAKINVGTKYPIVFYDPRAGQFQVTYVDIGTKIEATPEVKADGYIVTTLKPTTSTNDGLVNNQYPITSDRSVETKMRVKDGDTVIIGGLVRDEERHVMSKIPLLGDIPILGALFRMQSDSKNRSEVVFMVTPHIMK